MKCVLTKGLFGRWVLMHPDNPKLGWSGARWVPMADGVPTGQVQVSNFATEDAAYTYAVKQGFSTITVRLKLDL